MNRRVSLPLLLASVLAAAALALAGAAAAAEPIVATDLLEIRTADEIDVSADGRRAVWVVTSIGETDGGERPYRYRRHLWLADLAAGTPPRQLTHGDRSDRAPTFSPDGSRIAFVRVEDGKPQVWVLPLDGGEAFPVTEAEHGAAGPAWSPDGKRLLYRSSLPLDEIGGAPPWPYERPGRTWGDVPPPKKKAKQASDRDGRDAEDGGDGDDDDGGDDEDPAPAVEPDPDGTLEQVRAWLAANAREDDPRVITRLQLQGELGLTGELEITQLFAVEVGAAGPAGEAVRLTSGFLDFGNGAWSPDGTWVVAAATPDVRHPDRELDADLFRIAADGSGLELLLDLPGWGLFGPGFSPAGDRVVFRAVDLDEPGYSLLHLGTIAADGGGEVTWPVRALDLDVLDLRWSDDGRHLLVRTRSEGAFPLLRVPAAGGTAETVVGGPRGVQDFDAAGGRLVYSLTEAANPSELYAATLAEPEAARRLTELNIGWLADKELSLPVERWLERPDGTRVQYWVIEPLGRDPGVRYPLVLEIHGGPAAMWGPGERTMWHELQLLASWGYGVVYANPRGSGGYGFAHRKGNYRDWGTGPAGDVLAALDEATRLPWVDRDQLFVTGGSYAGYLTAWIVAHDRRFRAAVAQRGVYELGFFFGEGLAWRLVPNHFGGYPWEPEAREVLAANSPLTFVDRIETPLLIIHSDRDLRTGVNQSEALYKSLKVLGRPVEYVRYPNEGHDLSRTGDPERRIDRVARIVEFFERWAEHPEPPPAVAAAAARSAAPAAEGGR